jgi:predicted TPR repeat methyltransferase
MRDEARYFLRIIAYTRAFEWLLAYVRSKTRKNAPSPVVERDYWDEHLSGRFRTYIHSNVTTDSHAHVISVLARHHLPQARSALDLGCGAGLLAETLRLNGFDRYTGVDISQVAIDAAAARLKALRASYPETCIFETGALGSYVPGDLADKGPYDLIVLSEVLYYLDTAADARTEVERCARWLSSGGCICVSLKDDGKSRAIVRKLSSSFEFIQSMLFQIQPGTPTFGTVISRSNPAFLAGLLRPRR